MSKEKKNAASVMEMDEESKENRNDTFSLDRAFIISLFYEFCGNLPEDIRRGLARSEGDALQFIMVLRPRLTSFVHRHISSLRHPAVSMAARQYFNELRTYTQEEKRLRGSTTPRRASTTGCSPGRRGSGAYDRRSSRGSSQFFPSGSSITLEQLARNKWDLIGACHNVVLQGCEPRRNVMSAIARSKLVNDIIYRYWERMTVPPNEAELELSFDFDSSLAFSKGALDYSPLLFVTRMTAQQYVYLHLRIAGILLPPSALEENLLDSIILDLRTDSKLFEKSTGLSFGDALNFILSKSNPDAPVNDVEFQTPERGSRGMTREDILNVARSAAPNSSLVMNITSKSFDDLPSISFGQFWESMLELSDNWTSSVHPIEHAIFLIELYCEVFAHEWDDEEAALLKSLRATMAETSEVQHEDLLSLVDYEDVSMLPELANLVMSATEAQILGFSYWCSTSDSKPHTNNLGSVCSEKPLIRNTHSGSDFSGTTRFGSEESWPETQTPVSNTLRASERRYPHAAGRRRRQHRLFNDEKRRRGKQNGRYMDDEEYSDEVAGKEEDAYGERRRRRMKQHGIEAGEEEDAYGEKRHGRMKQHGIEAGEEEDAYGEGRHGRMKQHGIEAGEEEDAYGEKRHGRMKQHGIEAGEEGERMGSRYGKRRSSLLQSGYRDAQDQYGDKSIRSDEWEISSRSYSDLDTSMHSFDEENFRDSRLARPRNRKRHGSLLFDKNRLHADERYYGTKRDSIFTPNKNRHADGTDSGEASLSSDASLSNFIPGKHLTRAELKKLLQKEQRLQQLEQHGRRASSGKEYVKGRKDHSRRHVTFVKNELAAKRQAVINALSAKGITIAPELLTDEDVMDISENSIDSDLLRRLMAGAGYAAEDLKESDFLHILLGDKNAEPVDVNLATKDSVLAALRRQRQRKPPETEYARRRREQQEQLERQRLEEEIAAERNKRREERRLRHQKRRSSLANLPVSDVAVPATNFELPSLLPPQSVSTNKQRPGGVLSKMPKIHDSDSESDGVPGIFLSNARLQLAQQAQKKAFPKPPPTLPRFHGMDEASPSLGFRFFTDEAPKGMLVHEHSEEQLELFYRKIKTSQPIKGPARLAPPLSINGGTYHQLSLTRVEEWKAQRERRRTVNAPSPEQPEQYRCVPIKLFSLTTRTSLAAALRENLQRYIDDKAYLNALYKSYSR